MSWSHVLTSMAFLSSLLDAQTAVSSQQKWEKFAYRTLASPNRVEVHDSTAKWVATFTSGAHTATLRGPRRVFAERSASDPVEHDIWVRTLPRPFEGKVDENWLTQALLRNAQGEADILATGMQYVEGAPAVRDARGIQIAGDASYGPESGTGGRRRKGSDVQDYLGEARMMAFATRAKPEASRSRSLDCSGFMRMIWGFRNDPGGLANLLPRRSWEMLERGPGLLIIPNNGSQAKDFSALAPGDVVFFDAVTDRQSRIDHVGILLGKDRAAHWRFLSSRQSIDGPTMGDFMSPSIIDGDRQYARAFRAARRF